MTPELFLNRAEMLGEGMMCLPGGERLAWVDILGKRLMLANADGAMVLERSFDSEIGAVLPGAGDELILVLRKDVVAFDPTSGADRHIWSADGLEPETNRFNDAAVDAAGNLWIGSMDFDAEAETGVLWRLTPCGQAEPMARGYRCLNGPAFSPDGRTLYLGDTMGGKVLAFDLELQSGGLSNERLFVDLGAFGGLPDGMTVDTAGNVWLCQITAGRIGCYAPNGKKLKSVALPVPMVTSCCFGGPDLKTLYATTARILLDDVDLEAYPDSGSLYTIRADATGLVANRFGVGAGAR
ncbi:SMP-30/gluconolactonase/LRE family protein [Hoeflea prorocentri]|uniref:SMP-30/gluconolactonase/LRE family protein n=1 Tax=Hoeflea prorocentri TaxID=1922333 RepID=A0A9X3UN98_9HYPH|nr:SMP-30/gluconolactonase/LRE family protein [Hoeflea prorocentri]MCY6383784.1 SMP-30/gluconolactonase/LRE family protein [Hoeflea prorocentri]MDA5401584.1 SMP-30/gluconolactonase/LRE family protein [Hoeflea prorocentri]